MPVAVIVMVVVPVVAAVPRFNLNQGGVRLQSRPDLIGAAGGDPCVHGEGAVGDGHLRRSRCEVLLTLKQFMNAHQVATVGLDPRFDAGLVRGNFGLEPQDVRLGLGHALACTALASRDLDDLGAELAEHDLNLWCMVGPAGHGNDAVSGKDFAVLGEVTEGVTDLAGLAGLGDQNLQSGNTVEEFEREVKRGETCHHVALFGQRLNGRFGFVNGAKVLHDLLDSAREGAIDEALNLLAWHGTAGVDRRSGGTHGTNVGQQFTATFLSRGLTDTDAFLELLVGLHVNATQSIAGGEHVVHAVERSRHGEAGHLDHREHGITSGVVDGVEQQVHCCVGAPRGGGGKGIGGLGAFGADLVGLGFSLGAGRVDGGAGVCGGAFGGLGNRLRGSAAGVADRLAGVLLSRSKEGVSLALCGLDAAKDRFHAHGQHLILSRAVGVRFMSMMHHFAEGLIPD